MWFDTLCLKGLRHLKPQPGGSGTRLIPTDLLLPWACVLSRISAGCPPASATGRSQNGRPCSPQCSVAAPGRTLRPEKPVRAVARSCRRRCPDGRGEQLPRAGPGHSRPAEPGRPPRGDRSAGPSALGPTGRGTGGARTPCPRVHTVWTEAILRRALLGLLPSCTLTSLQPRLHCGRESEPHTAQMFPTHISIATCAPPGRRSSRGIAPACA